MKLSAGLSASEVGAVRRRLEARAASMQRKADELCRRLAEAGVAASVAGVAHDESGELRGSIRWEKLAERDYLVVADCGYAVYVELGTGVVGSGGAYPAERPAWAGAPGSRSRAVGSDGTWTYYDEKQSRWRATRGQVPQGFMARGARAVRQTVVKTAKEVFAT